MLRKALYVAAVFLPAPALAQPIGDAYVDERARELVRLARQRRNTVDKRIEAYRTTARERFSVGLRAGIGEKLVYRRETVTRIDWARAGPVRLEVLRMREVSPLFDAEPAVPDDMSAELLWLAFDPGSPEASARIDTATLRMPLAEGSEAHYRFESGDSTVIRLPDGRSIVLRELRFIPRRNESSLIRGSYWIDTKTHAVVRMYFKLAAPFDSESDEGDMVIATTGPGWTADGDGDDDRFTASDIPGFLEPLRADIDYIAIEYGLWELEWWLPRRMVIRGMVQLNRFRIPLTYERTYDAYSIRGDPAGAPVPAPETEPVRCRQPVRFARTGVAALDSVRQARTDAERERRARWAAARRAANGDTAVLPICDREVIIAAAGDSALIHSPELPASVYAGDVKLISEDDLAAMAERARAAGGPAWAWSPPRLEWGLGGAGLVRYNRVEGLSVGARATFDLGAAKLTSQVRLGFADRDPRGELALDRHGDIVHTRFAAYRRLPSATLSSSDHGTGASLGALLFGRDDGEYFDAVGAELVVRPPDSRTQWYDLRVYGERQRAVERNTDVSIAHLLNDANAFRGNFTADPAEQLGARLRLRGWLGRSPTSLRVAGQLSLEAETGDYEFVRPAIFASAATPLPFGLALDVEAAAGTAEGSRIPSQALWRLGGASTLRGYPGNALTGERYWRARAELGWGVPSASLSLFSDIAWAGPRDRFDGAGALVSAGAGVSLIDGLFRIDLARGLHSPGGWRLHV
ncbi:MAG: hypothetical protein ACRELX_09555, partial [Longimicrobiales bacterium]